MRILLADHSENMLISLQRALMLERDVQIVGKVMNTESLWLAARQLLPDLVLLDWQLASLSRHTLIAKMHQLRPELKVIAMVTHIEDGRAALAAGVDAIVSKSDPPDWLLNAVRNLVTKPSTASI
jgi:DNA-binding NarL/FixJ family response regulator